MQAKEAMVQKQFAPTETIDIQSVLNKISDEDLERSLLNESSDGEVTVYVLPGGNIAVPILDIFSSENSEQFVHVKDFNCPLDNCAKKAKSKKHTLVQKGVPLCPHSMLVHFLPKKMHQDKISKQGPQHQIDHHLTVQTIMSKLREKFPPSFKSLREGNFVKNSRSFVDSLLSSPEKLRQVLENVPLNCEFCGCLLEDWSHKEMPLNFVIR